MQQEKLMIVDGMALLFRSFFQTAPSGRFMVNPHGVPTNAVQGMIRHLFTAAESYRPTHITVCWDMGKTTFRTEMFSDYKAHRPPPPPELIPQFQLVQEAVAAFAFCSAGVVNYEADDCIGTIARKAADTEKIIVTGDRDLLQLLSSTTDVWLLKNGYGNWQPYSESAFREEYGIEPAQFHHVKAFMGDAADGYPGVKGIGEKTALKLIQSYGSVAGVLDHLSELTPAQQRKITESRDVLLLSERLADIHCDVPLDWTLEQACYTGPGRDASAFVEHHGLTGLRKFVTHSGFLEEDPFS